MNTINLTNISINESVINYDYEVDGDWKEYFNMQNKLYVEFSEKLADIPVSIASIPFLTNILPIVWLCDAVVYIDEVDEDFYRSIYQIKEGYIRMYPSLNFAGKIMPKKIVKENKSESLKTSGVFFSGGVDAFSTLFSHIEESPALITIWGADVPLDDFEGWKRVRQHVEIIAETYSLEKIFIKTNFRYFINENKLNELVSKSGDGWWHGFQCGIGLVGHSAPYAFKEGLNNIYIASSYTPDYEGTTASHPDMEGQLRFSRCKVELDQYGINRQEKIGKIVSYSKKNNKSISLRVCWKSSGGGNCCSCEKCYRSIMGLLAEDANPQNFGFLYSPNIERKMIKDLKYKVILGKTTTIPFWKYIQNKFYENQKNSIKSYDIHDFEWFTNMNIDKFNDSWSKIIIRLFMKLKRSFIQKY